MLTELNNEKALAEGLNFRPLGITVAETHDWYRSLSVEEQRQSLLLLDEGAGSLEQCMASEMQILAAWKADGRR